MQVVKFISCEDDGTDQIVSFAIEYGEADIRSLILLRTPKYEAILDEDERGVSVSLEHGMDDNVDLLEAVRIEEKCVTIETRVSKHELNVSRVDPVEVSEMKALLERMNFDDSFEIENA